MRHAAPPTVGDPREGTWARAAAPIRAPIRTPGSRTGPPRDRTRVTAQQRPPQEGDGCGETPELGGRDDETSSKARDDPTLAARGLRVPRLPDDPTRALHAPGGRPGHPRARDGTQAPSTPRDTEEGSRQDAKAPRRSAPWRDPAGLCPGSMRRRASAARFGQRTRAGEPLGKRRGARRGRQAAARRRRSQRRRRTRNSASSAARAAGLAAPPCPTAQPPLGGGVVEPASGSPPVLPASGGVQPAMVVHAAVL